ncbi:MAG: hypothetical protein LBK03_05150 [Bacteroidales bacterium]|jgi:hypothetical protein|nr:hypothetical protein [Bacteroidales bacterium]
MIKQTKIITVAIIGMVIASGIIFYACEKSTNKINPIGEDFEKVLNKNYALADAAISVSFADNPYDYQGEKHNQLLQKFFDEIYQKIDSAQYARAYVEMASLPISDPDAAAERILGLKDDIISKEGYNSKFINSLSGISETEKQIVNLYFKQMQKLPDLNSRIALSKEAESFILQEKGLSPEEKEEILSAFAIYRYSTWFWDSMESQLVGSVSNYDIYDAIGFYIATKTILLDDDPDWDIQDGKDAHAYASFVSMVTCFALREWTCFF